MGRPYSQASPFPLPLRVVAGLAQELVVGGVVEPWIVRAGDRLDVIDDRTGDDETVLGAAAVRGVWCAWQSRSAEAGAWHLEPEEFGDEPEDVLAPAGAIAARAR